MKQTACMIMVCGELDHMLGMILGACGVEKNSLPWIKVCMGGYAVCLNPRKSGL